VRPEAGELRGDVEGEEGAVLRGDDGGVERAGGAGDGAGEAVGGGGAWMSVAAERSSTPRWW
jgi:hypothetical protein